MSKTEYQTGDVARITWRQKTGIETYCEKTNVAVYDADADWWSFGRLNGLHSNQIDAIVPLVSFNPVSGEEIEQVFDRSRLRTRLESVVRKSIDDDDYRSILGAIQDHLANKVFDVEPPGIGAVVEDYNGHLWVRGSDGDGWWRAGDSSRWTAYVDIIRPMIRSKGYTPPEPEAEPEEA